MSDKKAPPREFWFDDFLPDKNVFCTVISRAYKDYFVHVIEYSAFEEMKALAERSEKLLIERNQNAVLAVENYNRINGLRNEAIERTNKAESDAHEFKGHAENHALKEIVLIRKNKVLEQRIESLRAALVAIRHDWGTDSCDGNTLIAHEALAEDDEAAIGGL